MSAPISPGGVTSPSDTASVNTAISSAPCGVRLVGDRRAGRAGCRRSPASARRRRTRVVVDRGEKVLGRRRRPAAARRPRRSAMRDSVSHDLGVVRMQPAREHRLAALGDAVRHQHRLGGAGRAVVHRGVRHLHAGERRDLGLELEQILQRALRDLGLVGRVAGQELGALDQVVDARRHVVLVGAGADEERHRRRPATFLRRHAAEDALDLELALAARQIERRRRGACPRARRRTGRRCRLTPMRASISPRSASERGR